MAQNSAEGEPVMDDQTKLLQSLSQDITPETLKLALTMAQVMKDKSTEDCQALLQSVLSAGSNPYAMASAPVGTPPFRSRHSSGETKAAGGKASASPSSDSQIPHDKVSVSPGAPQCEGIRDQEAQHDAISLDQLKKRLEKLSESDTDSQDPVNLQVDRPNTVGETPNGEISLSDNESLSPAIEQQQHTENEMPENETGVSNNEQQPSREYNGSRGRDGSIEKSASFSEASGISKPELTALTMSTAAGFPEVASPDTAISLSTQSSLPTSYSSTPETSQSSFTVESQHPPITKLEDMSSTVPHSSDSPVLPPQVYYQPQIAMQNGQAVLLLQPVLPHEVKTPQSERTESQTSVPLILPLGSTNIATDLKATGILQQGNDEEPSKSQSHSEQLSDQPMSLKTLNERFSSTTFTESDMEEKDAVDFTFSWNDIEDVTYATTVPSSVANDHMINTTEQTSSSLQEEHPPLRVKYSGKPHSQSLGTLDFHTTNPFTPDLQHEAVETRRSSDFGGARPKIRNFSNPFVAETDVYSGENSLPRTGFSTIPKCMRASEETSESKPPRRERISSETMVTVLETPFSEGGLNGLPSAVNNEAFAQAPNSSLGQHQMFSPSTPHTAFGASASVPIMTSSSPGSSMHKVTPFIATTTSLSATATATPQPQSTSPAKPDVSKPEATKQRLPGQIAPLWVPDEHVENCAYCYAKFTLVRRRHHCRACGRIFCSDCCSQLARLAYLQYQIVRICKPCTQQIKEILEERSKRKVGQKGSAKTPSKTPSSSLPSSAGSQAKTASRAPQPNQPSITHGLPQGTIKPGFQQNNMSNASQHGNIEARARSSLPSQGGYGVSSLPMGSGSLVQSVPSSSAFVHHHPQSATYQGVTSTGTHNQLPTPGQSVANIVTYPQPQLKGSVTPGGVGQYVFVPSIPNFQPGSIMFTDPVSGQLVQAQVVYDGNGVAQVTNFGNPVVSQSLVVPSGNPVVNQPPVVPSGNHVASQSLCVASGSPVVNQSTSQPMTTQIAQRKETPHSDSLSLRTEQQASNASVIISPAHPIQTNIQTTPTAGVNTEVIQPPSPKTSPSPISLSRSPGEDTEGLKMPLRPAGRTVTWRGVKAGGTLSDKGKTLARNLKELPAGVVIEISGGLEVAIRRVKVPHDSGAPQDTWCYFSRGFQSFKQQEIVILLQCKKEDVFPQEVLRIYRAVHSLVKTGTRFNHGNYLAFKNVFLDSMNNGAFLFVADHFKAKPSALRDIRSPFLYGVLVKRAELVYAMYTPTRLLLRIGQELKQFPFPVVNNRDRSPVYDGVDQDDVFYSTSLAMNTYLKNRVPEALIPGLLVLKDGVKITLHAPTNQAPAIVSLFDRLIVKSNQTATIPLLSDISVRTATQNVFHQGIKTKEVMFGKSISLFHNPVLVKQLAEGSSNLELTGLGFLILHMGIVDTSSPHFGGQLVDDGAVLYLSKTATQKIRQSLHERSNCHFYLGDKSDVEHFELQWNDDPNPPPQSPAPRSSEPVIGVPQGSNPGTAVIDIKHAGYKSEVDALKSAATTGVRTLLTDIEGRIHSACVEPLMLQSYRMRSGEVKELQLRVTATGTSKRWSIGPGDQPVALIRSLQMALHAVRLPELYGTNLGLSFDVTVRKQ